MQPEWLPRKVNLNGTLESDYRNLNDIYLNDIVGELLEVEGVPVRYDGALDLAYPPYTKGFTHLVTREIKSRHSKLKLRVFDHKRAEKLNWVAPILRNYKNPCVSCFWFDFPRGMVIEKRLAVWLEEWDYILILRWASVAQHEKILLTAYHVDGEKRWYWQSKRSRPTSKILHF